MQSFYQFHLDGNPDNSDIEKSNLHRDSENIQRKYYDLSTSFSKFNNDRIKGTIATTYNTNRPQGGSSKLDRHSAYDNFVSTVYRRLGQQRKN